VEAILIITIVMVRDLTQIIRPIITIIIIILVATIITILLHLQTEGALTMIIIIAITIRAPITTIIRIIITIIIITVTIIITPITIIIEVVEVILLHIAEEAGVILIPTIKEQGDINFLKCIDNLHLLLWGYSCPYQKLLPKQTLILKMP
jgi:hypothetical protein